jgi:hypothetical protein
MPCLTYTCTAPGFRRMIRQHLAVRRPMRAVIVRTKARFGERSRAPRSYTQTSNELPVQRQRDPFAVRRDIAGAAYGFTSSVMFVDLPVRSIQTRLRWKRGKRFRVGTRAYRRWKPRRPHPPSDAPVMTPSISRDRRALYSPTVWDRSQPRKGCRCERIGKVAARGDTDHSVPPSISTFRFPEAERQCPRCAPR